MIALIGDMPAVKVDRTRPSLMPVRPDPATDRVAGAEEEFSISELLDHVAIARILPGKQLGGDPAHALEAPLIVRIFAIPVQSLVRDRAQLIGPQAQPLPQIR